MIEPEGVAVSPDGRWVYITAEATHTVTVVDAQALSVVKHFLVGNRPRVVEFSNDGSRAYVSAEIGGTVSVIDPASGEILHKITFEVPGIPPEVWGGAVFAVLIGLMIVTFSYANRGLSPEVGEHEDPAELPADERAALAAIARDAGAGAVITTGPASGVGRRLGIAGVGAGATVSCTREGATGGVSAWTCVELVGVVPDGDCRSGPADDATRGIPASADRAPPPPDAGHWATVPGRVASRRTEGAEVSAEAPEASSAAASSWA